MTRFAYVLTVVLFVFLTGCQSNSGINHNFPESDNEDSGDASEMDGVDYDETEIFEVDDLDVSEPDIDLTEEDVIENEVDETFNSEVDEAELLEETPSEDDPYDGIEAEPDTQETEEQSKSCLTGADCYLLKYVCSNHSCTQCINTYDCLAETTGGYPLATVCIEGKCIEGECIESKDCPEDKPICGGDKRCRACQNKRECFDKNDVQTGFICDFVTGKCESGDCYPTGSGCGNKVCGADYYCRNCLFDSECRLSTGSQNAVCDGGACLIGCINASDCASGQMCKPDHRCSPCSNNSDCSGGYSYFYLCIAGMCLQAECNKEKACDSGRICSDNSCVDCIADDNSYCAAHNLMCLTGQKICVQCLNNEHCFENTGVCDNHVCRPCRQDECGDGRVCANGECAVGDCWIENHIWANGQTKLDNSCSICNSAKNRFTWSPNGGAICNDGVDCTYSDACDSTITGKCKGSSYTCTPPVGIAQCAVGVCHGLGPDDCTFEKKPSYAGCFLDDACYINNHPSDANPCLVCDAANNTWTTKPEGYSCGKCMACKTENGQIGCNSAPDGQDPNNDCIQNCQVCDSYGGCRWSDGGVDVNNDCRSEQPFTCGHNGLCAGGSDACAYYGADDSTNTDDGNPCTINDRCDGYGAKTGDAVPNGPPWTLCLSDTKVCRTGVCADCLNSSECGSGKVCSFGSCVTGFCAQASDCGVAPLCKQYVCNGNQCVLQNTSSISCNDNNLCTHTDTCINGSCVGTPITCEDDATPCGAKKVCDGTSKCNESWPTDVTKCDDGDPCTYNDRCNGSGACMGTSHPCDDLNSCTKQSCDDGNACTQTDMCKNGICIGANSVTCSALDKCHVVGLCSPTTGVCSNPAKPNGTDCDDGNKCNGINVCQNAVCIQSASPIVCKALDICHEAGSCSPTTGECSNPYKTNGVSCDDGNLCNGLDTCQNGQCKQTLSPVLCHQLDICHAVGTCDPTTGICDNPIKPNGTDCDDGNICNGVSSCNDGICEQITPPPTCGAIGCSDGVCNVEKAFVMTGNYTSGASVPDSSSLRITEPSLTLEAWVKNWNASGSNQIVAKGLSSNNNVNYAFGIGSHNAKFGVYIWVSTNGTNYTKWGHAAYTPVSTHWTHIAVVLDNVAQEARYYVNGRRLTDVESWPTWPSSFVLPSNGTLYFTTGYGITADELRISDEPRYTSDFKPAFRFEPDSNTRALWHFNEGTGSSLLDATDYKNNGVVSNALWIDDAVWRVWSCAPNWKECGTGSGVETCDNNGKWGGLQNCASGYLCSEAIPWQAICQ